MQRTDTPALIRHFNLNPAAVIECQALGCSNRFEVKDAFAVETTIQEEPAMAFLCSDECYIRVLHPDGCWGRA